MCFKNSLTLKIIIVIILAHLVSRVHTWDLLSLGEENFFCPQNLSNAISDNIMLRLLCYQ